MPYLADIPKDILARAAKIRLVAFDVDGTLTDGRLLYGEDGHELKAFHVQDGHGLKRLMTHGVDVALVSARISHVVALRAEEVGIDHVYQGQFDKRACLEDLLHGAELSSEQAAFVGDDLTDLAPMRAAGFAVAVANAHPWVIERAHWRTKLEGGRGAVREVCDLILLARGKVEEELKHWS
ncbi:MAG TPA: HAD hydrolase family protein [Rhodanobacteraceae bacterium]|nr:HAD hydrolase family protein [Rhodanobacteraceae bacterium]